MKRNIKNIEKLDLLKKDLSELQRMSDENMNKIDSIILKFEELVRNMKGVTMEQDIEILEELLNAKITFTISPTDYGWKALEHLIKAYKELEEERQIVGMPVRNKRDGRIGIVLHQWKSGSVAVLESINPRVINTHDSWNILEIVTDEVKQTQTKCETIPVSLVEETIEELNKKERQELKELKGQDRYFVKQMYQYKRSVLQELLEKRK